MDVAVNAGQRVDEMEHVDPPGEDEVENTAAVTNTVRSKDP